MDFLREAPEATGDEPEDTELEAPKVSTLLSFCLRFCPPPVFKPAMIDRCMSQSHHWRPWRSGFLFSSSSTMRR